MYSMIVDYVLSIVDYIFTIVDYDFIILKTHDSGVTPRNTQHYFSQKVYSSQINRGHSVVFHMTP